VGTVMLTVPTTCPFCACGCGFYLLAANGQPTGVAPSENHPVSFGRLCARGWAAHEAVLWGKRLRQPLIRQNGNPEPVSWSVALDHVTTRLRKMLESGKPIGVLGSARASNEENYLAGKLARAGLHTNNVDFSYHSVCRTVIEGLEDVTGDSSATATLRDIESTNIILLIEGDLAETHPQAASAVMKALQRGARLITIGCRRTQMARLASLHFQIVPGGEGEVINGLLTAVLHPGFQKGLSPSDAGSETNGTGDELGKAAAWITGAERAAFLVPPTIGPRDVCHKNTAALATLAAATGHLYNPGSGILPLLARSNARGACDMGVAPDRLPGYEPLWDGPARSRLENLWGSNLPSTPGMGTEVLLQSASGLIILADDPASVLPMGQRATAALQNIEFLVVLDAFVTPATELAHVALPIASFAETEGTVTSLESRVQRLRAATDPPGEARAGWEALAELCARLGVATRYNSAASVLHEITQAAPRYRGAKRAFDDGWSETRVGASMRAKPVLQGRVEATLSSAERPYILAHSGAFDWTRDPLVLFSPTLGRDSRSERKLFPAGFVEISQQDADSLGVHVGRRVRLTSDYGEVVVPVRLSADIKPGVLLVPYAFRDHVASVLAEDGVTAVKVEQI